MEDSELPEKRRRTSVSRESPSRASTPAHRVRKRKSAKENLSTHVENVALPKLDNAEETASPRLPCADISILRNMCLRPKRNKFLSLMNQQTKWGNDVPKTQSMPLLKGQSLSQPPKSSALINSSDSVVTQIVSSGVKNYSNLLRSPGGNTQPQLQSYEENDVSSSSDSTLHAANSCKILSEGHKGNIELDSIAFERSHDFSDVSDNTWGAPSAVARFTRRSTTGFELTLGPAQNSNESGHSFVSDSTLDAQNPLSLFIARRENNDTLNSFGMESTSEASRISLNSTFVAINPVSGLTRPREAVPSMTLNLTQSSTNVTQSSDDSFLVPTRPNLLSTRRRENDTLSSFERTLDATTHTNSSGSSFVGANPVASLVRPSRAAFDMEMNLTQSSENETINSDCTLNVPNPLKTLCGEQCGVDTLNSFAMEPSIEEANFTKSSESSSAGVKPVFNLVRPRDKTFEMAFNCTQSSDGRDYSEITFSSPRPMSAFVRENKSAFDLTLDNMQSSDESSHCFASNVTSIVGDRLLLSAREKDRQSGMSLAMERSSEAEVSNLLDSTAANPLSAFNRVTKTIVDMSLKQILSSNETSFSSETSFATSAHKFSDAHGEGKTLNSFACEPAEGENYLENTSVSQDSYGPQGPCEDAAIAPNPCLKLAETGAATFTMTLPYEISADASGISNACTSQDTCKTIQTLENATAECGNELENTLVSRDSCGTQGSCKDDVIAPNPCLKLAETHAATFTMTLPYEKSVDSSDQDGRKTPIELQEHSEIEKESRDELAEMNSSFNSVKSHGSRSRKQISAEALLNNSSLTSKRVTRQSSRTNSVSENSAATPELRASKDVITSVNPCMRLTRVSAALFNFTLGYEESMDSTGVSNSRDASKTMQSSGNETTREENDSSKDATAHSKVSSSRDESLKTNSSENTTNEEDESVEVSKTLAPNTDVAEVSTSAELLQKSHERSPDEVEDEHQFEAVSTSTTSTARKGSSAGRKRKRTLTGSLSVSSKRVTRQSSQRLSGTEIISSQNSCDTPSSGELGHSLRNIGRNPCLKLTKPSTGPFDMTLSFAESTNSNVSNSREASRTLQSSENETTREESDVSKTLQSSENETTHEESNASENDQSSVNKSATDEIEVENISEAINEGANSSASFDNTRITRRETLASSFLNEGSVPLPRATRQSSARDFMETPANVLNQSSLSSKRVTRQSSLRLSNAGKQPQEIGAIESISREPISMETPCVDNLSHSALASFVEEDTLHETCIRVPTPVPTIDDDNGAIRDMMEMIHDYYRNIEQEKVLALTDPFYAEVVKIRESVAQKVEAERSFGDDLVPRAKTAQKKSRTVARRSNVKLYRPAYWANKRLYDYLKKVLLPHFGMDHILQAESVVKVLFNTEKKVTKSAGYQKKAVDALKKKLAEDRVIVTTYDFYGFVREFMPHEFQMKVIPMVQPITNIVWPPKDSNLKESDPILK